MSQPLISLEHVSLSFNDSKLITDLTWHIKKDQHWAVVGPTGSGKSSLAKIINRNIIPDQGRVKYYFDDRIEGSPFFNRGEIIIISPEVQREFQQYYGSYHQARWQSFEGAEAPVVMELLSGKNIEHASPYEVTPLKVDETIYNARRDQAIKLLQIGHLLERKVHQLSNGETRKVMLARALMQKPQLLIFDDPFYGLDYNSRSILTELIEQLITNNEIHILFLTSRPEEVPPGITDIIRLEQVRVFIVESRDQLLQTNILESVEHNLGTVKPSSRPSADHYGEYLVEMANVSVTYSNHKVLADINWCVRNGEHWAVLGENGAGKSTLLSLILGDNPQAYANKIKLFGVERGSGESIWELKQKIGWVAPELQNHFDSSLSGFEVICSGFFDTIGLYHECSKSQLAEVDRWIACLGLERIVTNRYNSLSAGEQRLILIARAVVKNPKLLILDEPCQGLDPLHRSKIIIFFDQLPQQSELGLIYVTHYTEEIPGVISHLLYLKGGKIEKIVQR